MPQLRHLFCALIAGVAFWGCDAPPQPPEPTIEISDKIETLNAEVDKTRAEADKRNAAASKAATVADDADAASGADVDGE